MTAFLAQIHDASPVMVACVGLLAVQTAVLVLTGGIFVTTMLSANASLSLMRRTLSDASRSCGALEEFVEEIKTRASI